ncbi:MAG: rod shape-determining protein MreC [Acidimicrobiales bacterium]
MAVSRRSARPRFVLLVLVLLSATLITLDVRGGTGIPSLRGRTRDVFGPVQTAIGSAISPVTDFFHGVFQYSQLNHDNARLRNENAQLRAQQIQTQYDEQQIKDLNDLLKLNFVGDIPTVASRVVGGSESNFQLTIVIDRGTAAGVLRGMPVVSGSGLVGRVVAASATQSTVLLLTDASAAVGVQFAPAPTVAVATGQGAGRPLDVSLIDPGADVGVGNVAVTSGLTGSPYPRGIPVGRVSSIAPRPGVQAHRIFLEPVVDLPRLSYVDVLIWTPQTHPAPPDPTPTAPGTAKAPPTTAAAR